MKNDFKIIYRDANTIKINPQNPKIHTEEQIEQIKQSIKDFGFNDPIAIDENDVIIEGHGRLEALKQLGINKVPVIIISGLSEQQKTAYSLIHNQLTINTGFSYEELKEELKEIQTFDMSQYSFDIVLDDYFDGELINSYGNGNKVIIKATDSNEADVIRDYLEDNGYKYKEKK